MASPAQSRLEDGRCVESTDNVGPQLPFTRDELDACVNVLARLGRHHGLYGAPWLRPLRKAVVSLKCSDDGREAASVDRKRAREQDNVKREIMEKTRRLDEAVTKQCRLRAHRVATLKKLMEEQSIPATVPLVPDGPVREDAVLPIEEDASAEAKAPRELVQPRKCYACHLHFTTLHEFYDWLCPPCAQLNYLKRHQTADLRGKIALVTGARVKIGFFAALKLLHAGATVIATTRFPRDAAERFQREPRCAEFSHRLHVFGVDFHDLVYLHGFLDFVASTFSRLDVVIHNACQTIRRPPQYFRHLIDKEVAFEQRQQQQQLHAVSHQSEQPLLAHYTSLQRATTESGQTRGKYQLGNTETGSTSTCGPPAVATRLPPLSSPLQSQVPLLASDFADDDAAFPPGMRDVNGQQVDLRPTNSWVLRLGEVETPELAEVFAINATAPFVINSRLLLMLERSEPASQAKFIINVSSMEGKFHRGKRSTHPHTNMAKAALNMMTRTCAPDLVRRHIFMHSVDTGWINDENPLPVACRAAREFQFQPPLDEIDAAARVLDPIFSHANEPLARPPFGCFYKDYEPTDW